MTPKISNWWIYMVLCSDNTFYIGISTDVEKRVSTHNLAKGAKYTKPRLPVKLVYIEESTTHSAALKREFALKKLTRSEKKELCNKKYILGN
ncbi:hypothetical protein BH10PAT2_BH10PAT2_1130 [soil metagenome]